MLDALAADLRAARYDHDGVTELLGEDAHAALLRDQTVPARLVLDGVYAASRRRDAPGSGADGAGTDALARAVVVDLFLLGAEVPEDLLDAAFPRLGRDGLAGLRLVEPGVEAAPERPASDAQGPGDPVLRPAGRRWRASADLRPHASDTGAELWVASDLGSHQRPGVLRTDHVLGIGQASLTLAQTTVRRPAARALDLGTGCGIQTFHLLGHVDHVVATDVSARALAFARFNLLLNHAALGIDPADLAARVDLRRGSLLEPVAGESFDLAVSNPPFVITPRRPAEREQDRFTYRDGGLPGDSLVARLVSELPGVLAPGGTAQMLLNWEITAADGTAFDRPRAWLDSGLAAGLSAEAWLIQRDTESPLEYAEVWLRDAAEARDPERYRANYAAYLEDFASRDVESIGFGMLWLRRPADPARRAVGRRFEEIAHPIEQPVGPHLARAVAAADELEADLAAARFEQLHLVVADDVTEERHQRPGAEHPGVILLRQGAGLRRTSLLSTAEAGFVSACDGELAVGQIIGAIGALLGDEDPELAETLAAGVRRLIRDGFLNKSDHNR
ncbi:methyltransferase [Zhihengliuella sp.]|uniref:DUF7059 domain-containing protein n=1 Tax=Zhihengliuella sp. TaxID=1954483 RepID=UPI0028112E75|nr:methyltransferase [Zhihengliuella sp.]